MLPKLLGKLKEWAYVGLTFNLIFAVIGIVVSVSYVYSFKVVKLFHSKHIR